MFYSAGPHIRRASVAAALPAMQETWTVCAPRDLGNFAERISNASGAADHVGGGITFGYIHDGTDGKVGKTTLVSVFEPRLTYVDGETYDDILENFARGMGRDFYTLTEGGTWRRNGGNVLTCVDIMTLPEFRGMKIGGVKLSDILLQDLLPQIPREKWVVTYSPDIPEKRTAEAMHLRHGARLGTRIKGGRPGYSSPDVVVMVYRLPGFDAIAERPATLRTREDQ
jgi:GNAT superfamily N-acetyltransferase